MTKGEAMTLPDVIYWDYFTEEYCLEKDKISPPERYTATYKSCNGMFVERWEVTENSDGNRLNIAFSEEEYLSDLGHVIKLRQCQFDRHNCRPIQLISFSIPKHLFERYCLRLLGEDEENEEENNG